ncbi:MAG TPA: sugar kinase [Polaromonas sp.]|uniref:sugar kinase n=1 Tax=Polaromonas sp. TaxID=1869339 RepID=UPI002D375DA9|nr:sugar kinase [Polaromonas sp.]HYW58121.1 sugar kinase [Polaromonas sp.]
MVCYGECMVELSAEGPGMWRQGFAGDSFNTATYLHRLSRHGSLEVHYACGIGDDPFSGQMLSNFKTEGLHTSFVRQLPGRSCGLYSISVDTHGERSFAYWRDTSAARDYFAGERTLLELMASTVDVFYLTGISLAITPMDHRERLWTLLAELKRCGKQIVFDNNYRSRLWPSAKEASDVMNRCIAMADIALLGLEDVCAMHPEDSRDSALERCLSYADKEVVVKDGINPVTVRTRKGKFLQVPVAKVQPVDTTGAGDAFAAAYLAARLAGAPEAEAAEMGNKLAGMVVLHPGAIVDKSWTQPQLDTWTCLP